MSLAEGETVITVTVTSQDGSATSTHTITVTRPPNTEPTGLPTISGTARVRAWLTASVSGIADKDGLSGVTFAYQWIRTDGTTDTDIPGATQASHTLRFADLGKTIKVRTTFVDNGGTEEVLTSAATSVVEAPVELSVANAQVRRAADATMDFTVTLSRAASHTVTVDWATADLRIREVVLPEGVVLPAGTAIPDSREGIATAGQDYTADSGMLTFGPGETSKTVSISVLNDAAEADGSGETFSLRLSNPEGATIRDAEANGTILNDAAQGDTDPPSVSVRCAVVQQPFDYGLQVTGNDGSVSWDFYFSEPVKQNRVERSREGPFTLTSQEGSEFSGFVAWSHRDGIFPQSYARHWSFVDTPFTIVSHVNGVIVSAPAGDWRDEAGNPNTASGTPLYLAHNWKMSVADASAEEGTDETIDFEVTLNARDDCKTVTVDWATADGTATAGEDYTADSGTLTFAPGETSKTISIEVLDDTDEDSGETFTLQLSNATGATVADAEATGTIADAESRDQGVDDTEVPSVTVTSEATPPVSGEFDVTVTFNEPTSGFQMSELEVTNGSPSRMARLSDGTEHTVTIAPDADATGKITILVPAGVATDGAGNSNAASEVFEIAVATPPGVSIAGPSGVVTEGEDAVFTLTRTGATTAALTVNLSVSESGSMLDGAAPATVTFPEGAATVALAAATDDDSVVEASSAITASIAAGDEYAVDAQEASAEVAVNDNDTATFSVSASPEEIGEGEASTVTVAISNGVTFATDQIIALGFAGSTATKGTDFTVSDETLTLAAGASSVSASVTAVDDGDRESAETIAVSASLGGDTIGAATIAVTSSDALTASFHDVPATHDGSARLEFELRFSEEIPMSYRTVRDSLLTVTGGRVVSAKRMEPSSSTPNKRWLVRVIPQTTGDLTITLPATADCTATGAVCTSGGKRLESEIQQVVQGPSSVEVSIEPPPAAATDGQAAKSDRTAKSNPAATEGRDAVFTLTRTGATTAALTVNVSVSETGSMVDGMAPATVTFQADSATATLTVGTVDDSIVEDSSTITASIADGDGYAAEAGAASAAVAVNDNDTATFSVSANPEEIVEGGTSTVTVAISNGVTFAADQTIALEFGDGTATKGTDFTVSEETLTLAAGANSVTATLSATDDDETEEAETIAVAASHGEAELGSASVSISASDQETPLTAEFKEMPADHDGSASFTFQIWFSESIRNSYRAMRDSVLTVTGGEVASARRVEKRSDRWEIRIEPDGQGSVDIVLPADLPCASGVCTRGSNPRSLSTRLEHSVPGPAATPSVSITVPTSAVTEGQDAVFTLTRTGATAAALTVNVTVTESGSMLDGDPESEVVFGANAATATLTVKTKDDDEEESASTVTATTGVGDGYRIATDEGSATVSVSDNDAVQSQAPAIASQGPFTVDEGETAVGTLAATDGDSAETALSWSIPAGSAGGPDGDKFTLSVEGVLAFKAAKDFEAPDDSDTDGTYEVTVAVTDSGNTTAAALEVTLANVNEAPEADAGSDIAGVAEGSTVTLDGSGSSDPDADDTLTYAWSQSDSSGHEVTPSDPSVAKPTFTAPTGLTADAVLSFTLEVRDSAGLASEDTVDVTVASRTVVSISPATSPVTEGGAAAFVLRRTGGTAQPLTVAVSVTQAGAVLDGAAASSVTFGAGAGEARLSVSTHNDGRDEADGSVTASVAAGSEYGVDPSAGSARVDVLDNDEATATASETLWSATLEWTDMGDGWLIAYSGDFSSAGWTEDGHEYGIWYIAYGPESGELWLKLSSEIRSGGIPEPGELALRLGDLTVGPADVVAAFARGGTAIASGVERSWAVADRVEIRLTRAVEAEEPVATGPGISVADSQVREAEGAALSFMVTMGEAQTGAVSVRYRTSDGTWRSTPRSTSPSPQPPTAGWCR